MSEGHRSTKPAPQGSELGFSSHWKGGTNWLKDDRNQAIGINYSGAVSLGWIAEQGLCWAEQAARCRLALLHPWPLLNHLSVPKMEYDWYWLNDSGQWVEYGKKHLNHHSATVTSADLEMQFLSDPKATVFFKAGSQEYELNFEDMVQTNLFYGTQRKVVRLPRSLSFQGGQDRSQNMILSCHTVYPPQWDQSALPDIGFKLVQLNCASHEYGKIKRLFEKTMKNYCIHQLQRIQNPTLWQVFQWQKDQMMKCNKLKRVDERLLFHGTNPSHIPAICEQNFDWRICGTHGTMYGKGSYFARDASYSHHYCSSHSGRYSMIVAHVLVGDFVQGYPQYLRLHQEPAIQTDFTTAVWITRQTFHLCRF